MRARLDAHPATICPLICFSNGVRAAGRLMPLAVAECLWRAQLSNGLLPQPSKAQFRTLGCPSFRDLSTHFEGVAEEVQTLQSVSLMMEIECETLAGNPSWKPTLRVMQRALGPLGEGLMMHPPMSPSRTSSVACIMLMFLKLGCLMGLQSPTQSTFTRKERSIRTSAVVAHSPEVDLGSLMDIAQMRICACSCVTASNPCKQMWIFSTNMLLTGSRVPEHMTVQNL